MNDREYEATKRRVERLFDKWRHALGLRWWSIKCVWHRNYHPEDEEQKVCLAQTVVHWECRIATITFSIPALFERSEEEAEKSVVHELCHILVNQMREEEGADKHEEHVVTGLTDALLWTRDMGRDGRAAKRRTKARRKR